MLLLNCKLLTFLCSNFVEFYGSTELSLDKKTNLSLNENCPCEVFKHMTLNDLLLLIVPFISV